MKLGRVRPTARQRSRTLKLRDYLSPGLPTAPPSCDYLAKGQPALSSVYCNDVLGCCVVAGFYHVLGVASGNAAGAPFVATDEQIIADYAAIGGYVPGDASTDRGCNELDALDYWTKNAAADGSKLAGYVELDPGDVSHLQLALWLSGNLYFGLELPDAWVQPMPGASGFDWDAAGEPDPRNGHCIMAAGYDCAGVFVDSWGMMGLLTYAAIAKYGASQNGGAVYALLAEDWLVKAESAAPNGVDWTALRADLDALATPDATVSP